MLCALSILFLLFAKELKGISGIGSGPPRTIPCPDGLVRRLLFSEEK